MKLLKVLNIDKLNSSPAKELSAMDDIGKYRPPFDEVSFQRYDGTDVYQWHYRTKIYWHPSGPKFFISEK